MADHEPHEPHDSTRPDAMRITRNEALRLGLLAAAAAALAPAARAQEAGHAGHGAMQAGDVPASTQGYMDANTRMHAAMAIEYTGDPDIDFARAMIPHHQGAIDMANVVLANGEDPDLRQLAGEIIAAQEKEIAFLTAWLDAHAR
jgi:uncharacterized protein (DUF305 family)